MTINWYKAGKADRNAIVDGRTTLTEFSLRMVDPRQWIIVQSSDRWYVGTYSEFQSLVAWEDPDAPIWQTLSEMGIVSIGQLMERLKSGSALRIPEPTTPSKLDALLGEHGGRSISRVIDDAPDGTLRIWSRKLFLDTDGASPSYRGPTAPARDIPRAYDPGPGGGGAAPEPAEAASDDDSPAGPGLLEGDAAAPLPSELELGAPENDRWINAVLEDHDARKPLVREENYTLAISIDAEESADAGAVGSTPASELTRDRQTAIVLTVNLSSNDFDISDHQRQLKVNTDGLSVGKARFDIQPKLETGTGHLTAVIHRDNNFVQQLDISLRVGRDEAGAVSVQSTGRPVAVSETLSRRDIGISIQPSARGGFDCMTWGATASYVHLPISADELATEIEAARQVLLSVVQARNAEGNRPFQTDYDIDPAIGRAGLREMAAAGHLLFQTLFFHPASDAQCQALGQHLIDEVAHADEEFTLQILARDFPVPWSMLYLTDQWDPQSVDWNRFLGMKLVVEQIPLCNDSNLRDTRIRGRPDGLSVALNFNKDIDTQFNVTVVSDQEQYWQAVERSFTQVRTSTQTQKADLIRSLNDSQSNDQIIYFYCHAESAGLGVAGGPNQSRLILSGHQQVSLRDLNLAIPVKHRFPGTPLVFVNACESGQLSPLFYNGFVPYFLSKGARGVIGTECKIPALFAAEWAKRFFDDFLKGAPIGKTVLELRRNFYQKHNNPLGLLYGVHCNADTQINPLPD